MKPLLAVVAAALAVIAFTWAPAPYAADEAAVRAAVADYVDALYDVEPERIARSVHPDLRKLGYYRSEPDAPYEGAVMTYEQLHRLAGSWNRDNRQGLGDETPREIVVFDVLDQTASAKLVADWGVDYFHLAKVDDRWQIVNVLWQSPPPM